MVGSAGSLLGAYSVDFWIIIFGQAHIGTRLGLELGGLVAGRGLGGATGFARDQHLARNFYTATRLTASGADLRHDFSGWYTHADPYFDYSLSSFLI